MWTVIIGVVGTIVTLIVKAVIDAGSREHRARRAIIADLELLALVPDGFDVDALRGRIGTRLQEYCRPSGAPQSAAAREIEAEEVRASRYLGGVQALTVGLTLAGIAAGVRTALDNQANPNASAPAWLIALVVGLPMVLVVAVMLMRRSIRTSESELRQIEALSVLIRKQGS